MVTGEKKPNIYNDKNRKVDTVLFDFDGTLMNTNDLIIKSWNHTFLTFAGTEGPLEEIVKSFGEPLYDTIGRFFPKENPEEVITAYRAYHNDAFETSISLFPGTGELIKELREAGYTLGLVTSRLRRSTHIGLKKFGIFEAFDTVVTVEDTKNNKPDPEPVLLALSRLGKSANRAIMIGDTKHDIECAKNAGVLSVLVSWTMAVSENERESVCSDYVLNNSAEFIDILDEINRE
jgi:pyrophosphatase PpaX